MFNLNLKKKNRHTPLTLYLLSYYMSYNGIKAYKFIYRCLKFKLYDILILNLNLNLILILILTEVSDSSKMIKGREGEGG